MSDIRQLHHNLAEVTAEDARKKCHEQLVAAFSLIPTADRYKAFFDGIAAIREKERRSVPPG